MLRVFCNFSVKKQSLKFADMENIRTFAIEIKNG